MQASKRLIAIIVSLGFVLSGAILTLKLAAAPANPPHADKEKLSWSPTSLKTTVISGTSREYLLSFQSEANLDAVYIEVVPELRPYVQVTPDTFASVKGGLSVAINLTVSAPVTALPQTIDGTLHLRPISGGNARTIAKPMPIIVNVEWPTVTTDVVAITFPPSLQSNGGQIHPPSIEMRANGITVVDIPVSIPDSPPLSALGFVVYETSSESSISEWLRNNIDPTGLLLSLGTFRAFQSSFGNEVLISSGPIPDGVEVEPLALAYVRSRKFRRTVSITLSQDNYLSNVGLISMDERMNLIRTIAENLQVTQ